MKNTVLFVSNHYDSFIGDGGGCCITVPARDTKTMFFRKIQEWDEDREEYVERMIGVRDAADREREESAEYRKDSSRMYFSETEYLQMQMRRQEDTDNIL